MNIDIDFGHLYSKIKHEAKIFSNILYILGKIEKDGFFMNISQAFEKIIKSEMLYAVNELKKIQGKTPNFDLRGQLINNTYIYKENLKIISNMIGKTGSPSRPHLERKSKG